MTIGALALVAITLAGCGSQSANQSSNSSIKNSSSQAAQSNTNDNATSSNSSSTSTVKVDDKTAGVMLALLVEPDWFKDGISSGDMYYGVHGQDGWDDDAGDMNGWSYITANGDPTSFIHYRVNGDTVTYKYVDVKDGKSVAESPMVTKTVSLTRLEKDYYVNQSQKDEVNGYAAKLKPESAYVNSIKNNDHDDEDD